MAISFSDEQYGKISSLIDAQFPGFIRENGPNFVAFLRAYYEYLEQSGNAVAAARGLTDFKDVDRISSSFLKYLTKDILGNIPKNVLADTRLLAKYIRDIYASRGSEYSYRFLFRILFNKEIELFYPSEQILRASDGRWVKETNIRVARPFSAIPSTFTGKTVTGLTSGAFGRCGSVVQITILGVPIYELTVTSIVGTFLDGEILSDGTNTATIFTGAGSLTGLSVEEGGAYHRLNDTISYSTTTATGSSRVSGISNTSAIFLKINDGGDGYTLGNTVVKILGGSGSSANAIITALSNTHSISFATDRINKVKNIVLNTGPTFVSLGANTAAVSAPFAAANVYSTITSSLYFKTNTVGKINTIKVLNPGKNYNTLPTNVFAVDTDISSYNISDPVNGGYYGNNSILNVSRAPGTITSLEIIGKPEQLIAGDPISLTNIDLGTNLITNTNIDLDGQTRSTIRQITYNPTALPTTGKSLTAIITKQGRYVGTKGFISWDQRLEDNYYYQQFSYDIRVTEQVNKFRDVLNRLLHPSGTKFFTSFDIDQTIDISNNFEILRSIGRIIAVLVSESITVTDTITANFVTSKTVNESLTLTETPNANVTFAASPLETFTLSTSELVEKFTSSPIYIRVDYANDIIGYWSNTQTGSYLAITTGTFDGTARLVANCYGISYFANGVLVATSGLISNTGAGSNLMITPVGDPQNYSVYQVNTIFSNTAFSIRTEYLPITSNATFKYSTT